MYATHNARVNISHASVEGNEARVGGAYWMGGDALWMESYSTLSHNTAAQGGAIFLEGGSSWFDGLHLYNNTASQAGGSIEFNWETAQLVMDDCLFEYVQEDGRLPWRSYVFFMRVEIMKPLMEVQFIIQAFALGMTRPGCL